MRYRMVYGRSLRGALGRKLHKRQVRNTESYHVGDCLVELALFSHSKLITP
jgi:hypothetical protein